MGNTTQIPRIIDWLNNFILAISYKDIDCIIYNDREN